jgi:hypothetical protein
LAGSLYRVFYLNCAAGNPEFLPRCEARLRVNASAISLRSEMGRPNRVVQLWWFGGPEDQKQAMLAGPRREDEVRVRLFASSLW